MVRNVCHSLALQYSAIGTKATVAYAVLALDLFEDLYVYTYPTQPRFYLRHMDDIFLCWTEGRASLEHFIKHLNFSMDNEKVFLITTYHPHDT